MLSTGVLAEMVDHRHTSGEVQQLPKIISLYNQHMGGVDLLDQKVEQYTVKKKGSTNIGRNASLEFLMKWSCVHTYCRMTTPAIPQS